MSSYQKPIKCYGVWRIIIFIFNIYYREFGDIDVRRVRKWYTYSVVSPSCSGFLAIHRYNSYRYLSDSEITLVLGITAQKHTYFTKAGFHDKNFPRSINNYYRNMILLSEIVFHFLRGRGGRRALILDIDHYKLYVYNNIYTYKDFGNLRHRRIPYSIRRIPARINNTRKMVKQYYRLTCSRVVRCC